MPAIAGLGQVKWDSDYDRSTIPVHCTVIYSPLTEQIFH